MARRLARQKFPVRFSSDFVLLMESVSRTRLMLVEHSKHVESHRRLLFLSMSSSTKTLFLRRSDVNRHLFVFPGYICAAKQSSVIDCKKSVVEVLKSGQWI